MKQAFKTYIKALVETSIQKRSTTLIETTIQERSETLTKTNIHERSKALVETTIQKISETLVETTIQKRSETLVETTIQERSKTLAKISIWKWQQIRKEKYLCFPQKVYAIIFWYSFQFHSTFEKMFIHCSIFYLVQHQSVLYFIHYCHTYTQKIELSEQIFV